MGRGGGIIMVNNLKGQDDNMGGINLNAQVIISCIFNDINTLLHCTILHSAVYSTVLCYVLCCVLLDSCGFSPLLCTLLHSAVCDCALLSFCVVSLCASLSVLLQYLLSPSSVQPFYFLFYMQPI